MKMLSVVALIYFVGAAIGDQYTVSLNNGAWSVNAGNDPSGVAYCTYDDDMLTKGWAFLNLETNTKYTDEQQMYGAGYLEGVLSKDLIWAFYVNMNVSSQITPKYTAWMDENQAFLQTSIKANPTSAYWNHVSLVQTQLLGMVAGYAAANTDATKNLNMMDFITMGSEGDLLDVLPALKEAGLDYDDMDQVKAFFIKNSHCSSLVKLKADLSEIYHAHTTWQQFLIMVRMFKTYKFNLNAPQTNSKVVTFSSYPASLASVDDYYQIDTGLVVSETTNGIMNPALLAHVTPSAILSWTRTIVANRMATSGSEWVSIFSQYNSGTYNNQWIISDHNKLVKGERLMDGALFILEQIPGYIESHDVTPFLRYGYWPSYNVPFSEYIYNISGFPAYAKKFGSTFAYQNNPRGEIFRRDAGKVESVADMKRIMRYNDWQHDPLSMNQSSNAISSRFDLLSGPEAVAVGGIDSKVTSTTLLSEGLVWVQGGPTHDQQTPFTYTGKWADVPHLGQPTTWNFDWNLISANL